MCCTPNKLNINQMIYLLIDVMDFYYNEEVAFKARTRDNRDQYNEVLRAGTVTSTTRPSEQVQVPAQLGSQGWYRDQYNDAVRASTGTSTIGPSGQVDGPVH